MTFDFEKLFLAAPSPFVLLDRDLRMVWANDAYLTVTGRTRETLIGRVMTEVFPSDPQSAHGRMLRASFKRVFESDTTDHLPLMPYPIPGPHGEIEERYWSATHAPILGPDGRTQFVLQNTFDVTDLYRTKPRIAVASGQQADLLRRAEAVTRQNLELDSATEFFRMVFSQAPTFMAILTGPDHVFQIVNNAYLEIVGHRELLGRAVREALPEIEGQGFYDLLDNVYRTGEAVTLRNARVLLQRGEGEQRDELSLDFVYQPLFDASGQTAGIFVQGHDVTAQRIAETQLREAEEKFRTMAQTMPAHVWTASPDGALDWLSDRVHAYTGDRDALLRGDGWSEVAHPDDLVQVVDEWAHAVARGENFETEFRIRRADGEYLWHLVRATPVRDESGRILRWVGTNVDIDEQKSIEAALADLNATLEERVERRNRELEEVNAVLRQTQKMEAIGNLSGGVAHDFNNLLQAISGSLTFAARELPEDTPARERLDAATRAVERGAALSSQLLAFSRRQPLEPKPFDPRRLLDEMDHILRSALGDEIELVLDAADDLWPAFADATNTENAILNLVMNACDAMRGRGTLRIELANRSVETGGSGEDDLQAGEYVDIRLLDDGAGMTPEVVEKAFEPFFTTKSIGKGTGLGLATVYGFARQSGGKVAIKSELGEGTQVTLTLPRSDRAPEPRVDPPSGESHNGGNAAILLVEDDPEVRTVTAALLRDAGFGVTTAPSPDAAVELLQKGEPADLLLTDVVMPGRITTREMVEKAGQLRPGLPVLFISGYSRDTIVHDGRVDEGLHFLAKPFSQKRIVAKVHEVLALEARRSAGGTSAPAEPQPRSLRVLVCEDEFLILLDLEDMLTALGAEVRTAGTAEQALALLREQTFDALFTDVGLPDKSGEELAREAREIQPALGLVFATGRREVAAASELSNCAVITKPFGEDSVAAALARLELLPRAAQAAV